MTTNFVAKGTEIIKQAVHKDNAEEYEAALSLYSQGIQYLMTGLKYEKNRDVVAAIKEKVTKFLRRAEDIKTSLEEPLRSVKRKKKKVYKASYGANDDSSDSEEDELAELEAMMKSDELALMNLYEEEIAQVEEQKNDAVKELSGLIDANEKLRRKNAKIEMEKNDLQRKYEQLSINFSKVCNECKELRDNLRIMTEKYNKVLRKNDLDESKYLNWNSDLITDWIIGLKDEYKAYEHVLRANLKKEYVDGSLLSNLDKNDLHRFGIINLKHKMDVIKHIQTLTNNSGAAEGKHQPGANSSAFIW